MPKVIFNIGFTTAEAPASWSAERKAQHMAERAFYNGTAEYNYFSYTESDKKVVKNEETFGKAENYMEKTSGIFNKDGALSPKEKAELAEKLKKTKSIIWHGFISFDNETSPMFDTQKACNKFIKENFDVYFKENRINSDNMELFCSLHDDTDNRHIHFCFFEKKESVSKADGRKAYRRRGVFGDKIGEEYRLKNGDVVEKDVVGARKVNIYDDPGRDCFLFSANCYVDENKAQFYVERDIMMNTFDAVKPEIATEYRYSELSSAVAELGRKLPTNGRLSYLSENMKPLRPVVDAVVKKFIDAVPGLRRANDKWISAMYAKESEARKICEREGLDFSRVAAKRMKKEKEDYFARLGNRVLKMARAARFDSFKERAQLTNDLARKIASKNNRIAIKTALKRAVKGYTHGDFLPYNYAEKLHRIENEIERERQKQSLAYGG